jgi:hypothetical protein
MTLLFEIYIYGCMIIVNAEIVVYIAYAILKHMKRRAAAGRRVFPAVDQLGPAYDPNRLFPAYRPATVTPPAHLKVQLPFPVPIYDEPLGDHPFFTDDSEVASPPSAPEDRYKEIQVKPDREGPTP